MFYGCGEVDVWCLCGSEDPMMNTWAWQLTKDILSLRLFLFVYFFGCCFVCFGVCFCFVFVFPFGSRINNIYKFPDPLHWIQNCTGQWVERVFRFHERYFRKISQATLRKRETNQCNTAKLNQPRPSLAGSLHAPTHGTWKSRECMY